jgi:hypothetical protein
MANVLSTTGKLYLLKGASTQIDWANDTIKLALTTSSYTPSAAHDFFNDVTNEISGTGYTAGGAALASKTMTNVSTTAVLDAADVSWTTATITNARYGVLYKDTGTAATSPIIGVYDFGADQSVSSGTFTVVFSANGCYRIS